MISLKKRADLLEFNNNDGSISIFLRDTMSEICLSEPAYRLLKMLDGKCEIESIKREFPNLDQNKIDDILKDFSNKNLLETNKKRKKHFDIKNITLFYIRSTDFEKISTSNVKVIYACYKFFVLVSLIGLGLFFFNCSNILSDCNKLITGFNLFSIVPCALTIIVSIFLHEISHAIMIKTAGGHVVQYNFGFTTFLPFVRTVYIGKSKIKCDKLRLMIEFAGIITNLSILFVFTCAYLIVQSKYILFTILFNISLALFNTIIFFKTDGYEVLSIILSSNNPMNMVQKKQFKVYYKVICVLSFVMIGYIVYSK